MKKNDLHMALLCTIFCATALLSVQVWAQVPAPAARGAAPSPTQASEEILTPKNTAVNLKKQINPRDLDSLFFTFWEHNALREARSSRGLVRPPTEAELRRAREAAMSGSVRPSPGIRELSLGGIVYVSKKDWTIWLNEKRITPDALPKEVLDLRVHDEYIEIKWLDEYTAQIFPVRLKAHQRFNLDSRIFLPG